MSDADALEAAIRAGPDSMLPWAVYADYLAEQDDPRGEFMHVQLALEDAGLTPEQRGRLAAREAELLREHGAGWLGAIAPILAKQAAPVNGRLDERTHYRFRRGWLGELVAWQVTPDFAEALNQCREARFLRRFEMRHDFSGEYDSPTSLSHFPYWAGVREFHSGAPVGADFADPRPADYFARHAYFYLRKMPHIESITILARDVNISGLVRQPMPRLRHFHLGHCHSYPLEALAANKTVTKLTHLICRPRGWSGDHVAPISFADLRAVCATDWPLEFLRLRSSDIGDDGARLLAASGVWRTLRHLDLAVGTITDIGAVALASAPAFNPPSPALPGFDADDPAGHAPALSRLRSLNLSRNSFTRSGIAAIRAVMPSAKVGDQLG